MFEPLNFEKELTRLRIKTRKEEDALVREARRILQDDLFSDKKILENLSHYSRSFDKLDENEIPAGNVFTLTEIRGFAVKYRLRLLPLKEYKNELPYDAVSQIREMNRKYRKDLKELYVLAPSTEFRSGHSDAQSALFAETDAGNYYLIHRWGKALSWSRKIKYWPLRSFENLLFSVLLFTLALTLSLPTAFITLDAKAEYWSGYRAAAFFHLLIFNCGFTTYLTFAFSKNFSASVWNRRKDFS
jgi:hypothetical protein